MANNQTFIQGYGGGGGQVTSLSNIQSAGLTLPSSSDDFINIRKSGKLKELFETGRNSEVLYTRQDFSDSYFKGPIAQRFDYKTPTQGQNDSFNPTRTSLSNAAARRDLNLINDYLKSASGNQFLIKQFILQGFQTFDETKVYNPASPSISAARMASFGLLNRPTRHIDTSNVISGFIGATGLGSLSKTVGGLFNAAPVPAPPRSSVASAASNGLGLSTLTSLVGGGNETSNVMRLDGGKYDVKGLLRGKTATDAYNSIRYSRLLPSKNSGGFFNNLLSGIGRYIQNNTLAGGIIPPKQPWNAKFRADEKTYEYYLNSGWIFNPESTGISGGGIASKFLNAIGFGKRSSYSLGVEQRFNGKSEITSDLRRTIVDSPNISNPTSRTDQIGKLSLDNNLRLGSDITTEPALNTLSDINVYSDSVKVSDDSEHSDQLLNYKTMVDEVSYKNFSKTGFNDYTKNNFKDLFDNFRRSSTNIVGGAQDKYKFGTKSVNPTGNYYGGGFVGETMWPLQFSRFESNNIGQQYLNDINPSQIIPNTQLGRQKKSEEESNTVPSLTKRKIIPTNDVDFVNRLGVLNDISDYNSEEYNSYGPDIIKFYFYDIVNERYIPFRATVKDISDNNTAEWNRISYLGRADKLYNYKGFTRKLSFSFKAISHSVKELLPMWQRINYLLGLTRPANYTNGGDSGYIVPPMAQLTLGDFYKNHNVIIDSCNISIDENTPWEVLPETLNKDWYYGLSEAIQWKNSSGKYAQFPLYANIDLNMDVLEKERPRTGIANWGDTSDDNTFSKNLNITTPSWVYNAANLEPISDIE